jgi:hypothetical protein
VLSRGITKLVQENKIDLIKASNQCNIPSHVLYADDIMLFCRGRISCIKNLQKLFTNYALCSGQIINASKSTLYSDSIPQATLNSFIQLLGFQQGTFPFNCLGAPIFKGKPKNIYFQNIADKIKSKLSAWKASLLSIAGRVQLVKAFIQGMLIHTITIYDWPMSMIKDLEKCIRNFIWNGDISKRKLLTVSWKKVCKPTSEGGLGIRSISCINQAANLRLCWSMITSQESWAKVLKSRVIKKNKVIQYHIFSSIWSSIKTEYNTIIENTKWLLGDGETINFGKITGVVIS